MIFTQDSVSISGAETISGAKTFAADTFSPVLIVRPSGSCSFSIHRGSTATPGLRLSSDGINGEHSISVSGGNRHLTFCENSSGGALNGGLLIGSLSSLIEITAQAVVKARSTSRQVLVARGLAGQTADLFRAEDSGRSSLLRVSGAGALVHTQPETLGSFTVATLPSAAVAGQVVYASNGRAGLELGGAGTGVPVYSKGGLWRRYEDNTQVQA